MKLQTAKCMWEWTPFYLVMLPKIVGDGQKKG